MKLLANMMVKYQLLEFSYNIFNLFKPKADVSYLLIIDDNNKLHQSQWAKSKLSLQD
jgi:hypothetical protein